MIKTDEKVYYVYRWIRLDSNTPFYVGKGSGHRASSKYKRNRYFKHICSVTDTKSEIIFSGLTEKEAFQKEIEIIKLYKDLGYCEANLTLGGEGASGAFQSEETRKKRALANKGQKRSIEFRLRLSKMKKGLPGFCKGKIFSNEQRELFAIAKGAKPFIVLNKTKEIVGEWINKAECAKDLGLHACKIGLCLRGLRKSHKGHYFVFKDQSGSSKEII